MGTPSAVTLSPRMPSASLVDFITVSWLNMNSCGQAPSASFGPRECCAQSTSTNWFVTLNSEHSWNKLTIEPNWFAVLRLQGYYRLDRDFRSASFLDCSFKPSCRVFHKFSSSSFPTFSVLHTFPVTVAKEACMPHKVTEIVMNLVSTFKLKEVMALMRSAVDGFNSMEAEPKLSFRLVANFSTVRNKWLFLRAHRQSCFYIWYMKNNS